MLPGAELACEPAWQVLWSAVVGEFAKAEETSKHLGSEAGVACATA